MDGERSLFLLTRYRSTFTKSSNYNRRISKFHLSPSRLFQFFFFSFFPTRLPLHRQPYRTIRIRNMEPVTRSRSQPSVHPYLLHEKTVPKASAPKLFQKRATETPDREPPVPTPFETRSISFRNLDETLHGARQKEEERERESDASGRSVTPSRLWRGGRGMKGRR